MHRLAMLLMMVIMSAKGRAAPSSRDAGSALASYLSNRDFAAIGAVEAVTTSRVSPRRCRREADLSQNTYLKLSVRLENQLVGVPGDSVIDVFVPTLGDTPEIGAVVLVWGGRRTGVGSPVVGNWVPVSNIDRAFELGGPDGKLWGLRSTGLQQRELLDILAVRLRPSWGGPVSSATSPRAVALVRIQSVAETTDSVATCQIEFLRWLVGHIGPPPISLMIRRVGVCDRDPRVGDTLAVPVGWASGTNPLELRGCTRSYEVLCGKVRALGLDVDEVGARIQVTQNGLVVSPRSTR